MKFDHCTATINDNDDYILWLSCVVVITVMIITRIMVIVRYYHEYHHYIEHYHDYHHYKYRVYYYSIMIMGLVFLFWWLQLSVLQYVVNVFNVFSFQWFQELKVVWARSLQIDGPCVFLG